MSTDRTEKPTREESLSDTGPVGQGAYVVRQGESIESIAFATGFFHETLWNHPENAELKRVRRNWNVLLPGDRVTIPDKRPKSVACSTGKSHVFRRRGVPAVFRLQLLRSGEPRAGVEYSLEVDGMLFTGTTDGQGMLEHWLPPDARMARLVIGQGEVEYGIELGGMDPITEVTGIQKRLCNLGFDCPEDGALEEPTRAALRSFQRRENLPETGEPDLQTRARLEELHDWKK